MRSLSEGNWVNMRLFRGVVLLASPVVFRSTCLATVSPRKALAGDGTKQLQYVRALVQPLLLDSLLLLPFCPFAIPTCTLPQLQDTSPRATCVSLSQQLTEAVSIKTCKPECDLGHRILISN